MNRTELNNHAREFRKHLSTFYETSKSKPDDKLSTVKYCIPSDIQLEAVDFDAVQRDWYKVQRANGEKVPCSVDAMYFTEGKIYAVEFKSGINVEAANLIRKIYDTVMALIEKDEQDIATCRSKVEYIVVAEHRKSSQEIVNTRVAGYMSKPWDAHIWDRWKLYNLENVILSRAYVIPPELFSRFAMNKHWSE